MPRDPLSRQPRPPAFRATPPALALALLLSVPAAAQNPPSRSPDYFDTGRAADRVSGQSTLTNGTDATDVNRLRTNSQAASTSWPNYGGLAYDSAGNLWVADTWNHRVLRFPVSSVNGVTTVPDNQSADRVLGQGNFTSGGSGTGANQLYIPAGVWVDSSDRVWVADSGNHRVMRFDTTTTGASASVILGVAGSPGTSSTRLTSPSGVRVDASGNLWVADTDNHRVLRFPSGQLSGSGTGAADLVIGQTSLSAFATGAGSHLVTTNCTASGCNAPEKTLFFPTGLDFDASGRLWVSDHENHRILRFDPSFSTFQSAALVLGQAGFGTRSAATTQNGLNWPGGLRFDGSNNLWVADTNNHRVLRFPGPPSANNANADQVLGQGGFGTRSNGVSATALTFPAAVAFDPLGNLSVLDLGNNRVVHYLTSGFNRAAPAGTTSASVYVGQNYSGASTADCQLATDTGFSQNVRTSGFFGLPSFTFSSGNGLDLKSNATYHLRCRTPSSSYRILDSTRTTVVAPHSPSFSGLSATTLVVNWNESTNLSGTQYEVQIANDSGFTTGLQTVFPVTGNSRSFSGLVPNKRYYARVRAYGWTPSVNGEAYTAYTTVINVATYATMNGVASVLPTPPGNDDWISFPDFTYSGLTGDNYAKDYLYVLNTNASHSFTGSESVWTAASNLTVTASAPSVSWYVHIAARNLDNVVTPQGTFGPYSYDNVPPTLNSSAFRHVSSTGASLTTSEWTDTASVNWSLTAQDFSYSGLNLDRTNQGGSILNRGHWYFEEGAGTSAADWSGYGNNGFLVNGPTWTTGRIGGAINFDGTNDYVVVPSSPPLQIAGTALTVSAWINLASAGAVHKAVVVKGVDAEAALDWALTVTDTNRLRAHVTVGGVWTVLTANTALSAGTWYFVSMTYNGSTLKAHVNGRLDGSMAASGALGSSSNALRIGVYAPSATSSKHFFPGRIDEVRVMDQALTDDQIGYDFLRTYGTGPFSEVSTDGGNTWTVVRSTNLPTPRLGYSPSTQGTTGLVTVSGTAFQLKQSATIATGASATNQIRFIVSDVAGTRVVGGPYSILVETTAPLAVTTLGASDIGTGAEPIIRLAWDVRGGGGAYGLRLQTGSLYAIQYSAFDAGWSTSSAQILISTANVNDGVQEVQTITGLQPGSGYYFRVWTRDWVGNWSAPSNTAFVQLTPKAPVPDVYTNKHFADLVLGQSNFTSGSINQGGGTTASGFYNGTYILFDTNGALWVVDRANERVMRFTPPFLQGMNADLFIGQTGPNGSGQSSSAAGLGELSGATFDVQGRLWVADAQNNRVVRYTPPFSTGMSADLVLGQAGFGTSAAGSGQAGLNLGWGGVAADNTGSIWVGDYGNHRILRFSPPFGNGMNASLVLGQANFSGTSANRGTGVAQNTLNNPNRLNFDTSGNLWVADSGNHRVLRFAPPFTTGMNADLVLGQAGYGTNAAATTAAGMSLPWDVRLDGSGNVWVAEVGNHRVVRFTPPFSNGLAASAVLGQSTFTTNASATSQGGLTSPASFISDTDGRGWVLDGGNSRALRFSPGAFSSVLNTTVTVQIGPNFNSAGTDYKVDLDDDPAYGSMVSGSGSYAASLSRTFQGLTPNTTYYARARSRNSSSVESLSYTSFGSTITRADVPLLPAQPFTVAYTSAVFTWQAYRNPAGTLYLAQISTDAAFGSAVLESGLMTGLTYTFTGLSPDTVYYGRVRAQNATPEATGFSLVASTRTHAAPPPAFTGFLISNATGTYQTSVSTTNTATPATSIQIQSASVGLFVGQHPHATSSNTVVHLRFDEGTGTSASDLSPFRNHGAFQNSPTWSGSGMFGGAVDFASGGRYVRVEDAASIDLATQVSVEFWFRGLAKAPAETSRVLQKWNSTTDANFTLYWCGTAACSTDVLTFIANAGGTWQGVSGSFTPSLNTWYHVAWTYSSGGGGRLYVNGVQVGSATGGGALATNNAPLLIGNDAGATNSFRVDDLRILNRVLTSDEVAADYFSGAQRYATAGVGGPYTYLVTPANIAMTGASGTTGVVTSTVTAPQLAQGTNNHVVYLAQDLTGNTGASSAQLVFVDTTAPAAVTDLAAANVSVSSRAMVDVSWTATGNDGGTGRLNPSSYFAVQFATYTTGLTWSTTTAQVFLSTHGAPGGLRTVRLHDLLPDRPHVFRVWTRDNVDNWSQPSNVASLSFTRANPPTVGSNFVTGQLAARVLGQALFTTNGVSLNTADGMSGPQDLAFDTSGRAWVAEGRRVTGFTPPFTDGMSATVAIGQTGLTSLLQATAQNRFQSPTGLAIGPSGDLAVVDMNSHRVLVFEPPFATDMNAYAVLGQADFTSGSAATAQNRLNTPLRAAFDASGGLWVSDANNNRVVLFRPPFRNGMNASLVLGQSGFGTNASGTTSGSFFVPRGLAFDASGRLFVSDSNNNRILRFSPPFTSGMAADLVLGQTAFTAGTANAGAGFANPVANGFDGPDDLEFDGRGALWVADASNHRVLRFGPPFSTGMSADLALGQPGFVTEAMNTTRSGLTYPRGLAVDSSGLAWVADPGNHRVLAFSPYALTTLSPNSVESRITANDNPATSLYEFRLSSFSAMSPALFTSPVASDLFYLFGSTGNVSPVVPNTLYHGQAKARNQDGLDTPYTTLGSTRTQAAQPLALTVTLASQTLASLTWQPNLNPAQTVYEVTHSTDQFAFYVTTATPFAFGLTAQATTTPNLHPGTTYFFRVRAQNDDAVPGVYSAQASTETVPRRPTGLVGTVLGTSSIAWNWGLAGGPATRYHVYTATSSPNVILAGARDLQANSFIETGLSPNIAYGVYVEAFDNSGSGGFSETVTHYTLAKPPVGLGRISVSSFTIGLAWNLAGNPASTLFELSFSTDNFATHVSTPYPFSQFTVSSAIISGLSAGTSYFIRLRGQNSAAPPQPTAFATLLTQTLPGTVPSVTGSVLGVSSINWTWGSTGGGATLYRVFDAGSGALLANNLAVTTFTETGLSTNRDFGVRVEAFSVAGSAGLSPATTKYTHAAVPTGLSPTVMSTHSLTLAWSAAGNPAYTRYELSYSLDNFVASFSTPVAFSDGWTATTTEVTGLTSGPTYYFRLRAENDEPFFPVMTAFSAVLARRLPPGQIGTVTVTTLGTSSISWTWSDSGAAYEIRSASDVVLVALHPQTTYTRTGLTPNVAFGIKIAAKTGSDAGQFTDVTTGFTHAAAPGPITATAVSSAAVTLAWAANANPAYTPYVLVQSLDAFAADLSTPIPAGAVHTAAGSVRDGLQPGTTYSWKVRAVNQPGVETAFSAVLTTQTLPSPADGLTGAVLGVSSITWSWNSSGGAAALYTLRNFPSGTALLAAGVPFLLENTAGTMALWRFNEAAGASAADASGRGHPLTLTAAGWTAGRQHGALSFDGLSSFARAADHSDFDLDEYTLEAWIKTEDAGSGRRTVLGQGNDWALNLNGNVLEACDGRDLAGCAVKGVAVDDGQWHHLAVVRSEAEGFRFFVDGDLVGSEPASAAAPLASTQFVEVGRNSENLAQYFAGAIDEVRVTARALSDEEVAVSGQGKLPFTATGLTPNTSYAVTLEPVTADGRSAGVSASVGRYTRAAIPSGLKAVAVSTTSVALDWSQGGNASGTPYAVEASTDGFATSAFETVDFAAGLSTGATVVSALEPASVYTFRVRARNGEGLVTAWSQTASTTTRSASPSTIAGAALGVSSIAWSWAAAPGAGLTYSVHATTGAGLVGHWRFDESSGTAAGDASGNGSGGTLSGGASFGARGQAAGALFLDRASSGQVAVGTPGTLPLGNSPYTIEAWFRVRNYSGAMGIAGWGSAVLNQLTTLRLDPASCPNTLGFRHSWFINDQVACSNKLPTGFWHHVAATWDGTARKIYLDGVELASDSGGARSAVAGSGLFLGRALGGENFDGWLDDVRIYARALSPAEIAADMAGGPTLASGLGAAAFTQVTLSTDTRYGAVVRASNAAGLGLADGPGARTTLAAAPAALAVVAVTTDSVSLAWDESGNPAVTPYLVQVSTDFFATSVATAVPFGSGLTAGATTIRPLQFATPYQFRVRARNQEGVETEFSPVVSTFTLPGPPANLQGVVQGTSGILWSWTAAQGSTVSYRVRNSTSADILTETGATTYLQLGLRPNRTYGVTVEAFTPSGSGGLIGPLQRFTLAAVPAALATIPAPVLSGLGVSSDTVSLGWDAQDNPGTTPFELTRSSDGFAADFSTPVPFGSVYTATTAFVTGLQPGRVYHFRVRASNEAAPPVYSDFSNVYSTRTLSQPGAVGDLAAAILFTPGSVRLTWTSPGANGTAGDIYGGLYHIGYSSDTGADFNTLFTTSNYQVSVPTNVVPGRTHDVVLEGLQVGTSYTFALFTRNGEGVWSNRSNLTTLRTGGQVRAFVVDVGAVLDFGARAPYTTHVLENATQLRNVGNVPITYSVRVATATPGTPWTLAASTEASPGENLVFLQAAFAPTQPAPAEFTLFQNIVTPVDVSASTGAVTADGAVTGASVPAAQSPGSGQTRKLWYRLDTPRWTTTASPQAFSVTITGGAP